MEKIASFTIDHIKLEPGIYVSRKDHIGQEVITTFDLRMTAPNDEPVMNISELLFYAITQNLRTKPYTLGQWDAVPVFICFLPVIMNRKIL